MLNVQKAVTCAWKRTTWHISAHELKVFYTQWLNLKARLWKQVEQYAECELVAPVCKRSVKSLKYVYIQQGWATGGLRAVCL